MANFDDEAKGMLPFIGNTIEADITLTKIHLIGNQSLLKRQY